jgi:hypothetical protein
MSVSFIGNYPELEIPSGDLLLHLYYSELTLKLDRR